MRTYHVYVCEYIYYIAVPVVNRKRILCSDWFPEPLGIARFDPAQKQIWNGHTSAIELQKAAEDSRNKGNINDSNGFVLQTQLALFPASRNKQFSVHKIGGKKNRPVSSHLDIDLVNNAYVVTSIHRGKCCRLCLLSCPTEQVILKESSSYYLRVTWCFSWGRQPFLKTEMAVIARYEQLCLGIQW